MRSKKHVQNFSWYFIGTVATAFLGMLSTPMLTRTLSKEVYAQYGMVMSFVTAVASFIYLGQDDVFMRFYHTRNSSFGKYFWRCIRLPLLVCAIIFILLLEPNRLLLSLVFGENITYLACLLICLYLLCTVMQRFVLITARMEERAANYSISNIITKAIFLIAVLITGAIGKEMSFSYILICLSAGIVAAMVINIIVVIKIPHLGRSNGVDPTVKEMLSYGIPLAVTISLSFSIPVVEKIIIRQYANWDTLAIYTAAAIFITVMNMVKTTVNNIWTPYAFKSFKNEKKFQNTFHILGVVLTYLGALIVAGTLLTRRWLVLILDS